jgi:hypothetical protein
MSNRLDHTAGWIRRPAGAGGRLLPVLLLLVSAAVRGGRL